MEFTIIDISEWIDSDHDDFTEILNILGILQML